MDDSLAIHASHMTPSQSGQLIASTSASQLRIHLTARSNDYTTFNIRIPSKEVTSLIWSEGADQVAVVSAQSIEVVDLQDERHRVRLDNGAGGLGRFAAAEFVGDELLLVVWEFGRSKIWDLHSGKGVEIGDVKTTCDGVRWARRPGDGGERTQLALLSRQGAEDYVTVVFPASLTALPPSKLKTTDAQAFSWSPDGNWLAILDTPSASPHTVHIYTPDGQCYRSYPEPANDPDLGLGIKSLHWSPDAKSLALAGHDNRITLLNARTFSPRAVIEHSTMIDQATLPLEQRAPIWQEIVSPSHVRSHNSVAQPFSPPISRPKQSLEPASLGIAEACFSECGNFLATRDERMLSTVWVWDMRTLAAYTVIVQHANVRRMQWYRITDPDVEEQVQCLLLDCGEGVAYLWPATPSADDGTQPPSTVFAELKGNITFNFLSSRSDKPALVASTKGSFQLLRPYGIDLAQTSKEPVSNISDAQSSHIHAITGSMGADGKSIDADDDSLLDLLSGRTPMPDKAEPSYTEMIDAQAEDATATGELQDTFRGKQLMGRSAPRRAPGSASGDPFDDSEIF